MGSGARRGRAGRHRARAHHRRRNHRQRRRRNRRRHHANAHAHRTAGIFFMFNHMRRNNQGATTDTVTTTEVRSLARSGQQQPVPPCGPLGFLKILCIPLLCSGIMMMIIGGFSSPTGYIGLCLIIAGVVLPVILNLIYSDRTNCGRRDIESDPSGGPNLEPQRPSMISHSAPAGNGYTEQRPASPSGVPPSMTLPSPADKPPSYDDVVSGNPPSMATVPPYPGNMYPPSFNSHLPYPPATAEPLSPINKSYSPSAPNYPTANNSYPSSALYPASYNSYEASVPSYPPSNNSYPPASSNVLSTNSSYPSSPHVVPYTSSPVSSAPPVPTAALDPGTYLNNRMLSDSSQDQQGLSEESNRTSNNISGSALLNTNLMNLSQESHNASSVVMDTSQTATNHTLQVDYEEDIQSQRNFSSENQCSVNQGENGVLPSDVSPNAAVEVTLPPVDVTLPPVEVIEHM